MLLITVLTAAQLSTTDQTRRAGYSFRIDLSDGNTDSVIVLAGNRVQIDGTYYAADRDLAGDIRSLFEGR